MLEKFMLPYVTIDNFKICPALPPDSLYQPLVFLNGRIVGVVQEAFAGAEECGKDSGFVRRTFIAQGQHPHNMTEDRWHGKVEIYRAGEVGGKPCLFDENGVPDYEAWETLKAKYPQE